MEFRKLEKSDTADFKALIEIFKEVFENDEKIATAKQLENLLDNPDFLVFGVYQNREIIGGLTIYLLHRYYHSKPIAYIYDVGIKPNYQGKGYGKALMEKIGDYCRQKGIEEAYVEAESDDQDALAFYRKTKFASEKNATHFNYVYPPKNKEE